MHMIDNSAVFQWRVAADYGWSAVEGGGDERRSRLIEIRRARGPKVIEPLDEFPALFRDFAYVESTREGFLGFASKYGLLGIASYIEGESYAGWLRERATLRRCLDVWDVAHFGDAEALETSVRWNGGPIQIVHAVEGVDTAQPVFVPPVEYNACLLNENDTAFWQRCGAPKKWARA